MSSGATAWWDCCIRKKAPGCAAGDTREPKQRSGHRQHWGGALICRRVGRLAKRSTGLPERPWQTDSHAPRHPQTMAHSPGWPLHLACLKHRLRAASDPFLVAAACCARTLGEDRPWWVMPTWQTAHTRNTKRSTERGDEGVAIARGRVQRRKRRNRPTR